MDFFSQKSYDARNLLDVYVISAIVSVVVTRVFLYVTGYPELGGAGLHFAHVLWGGLLMAVGTLLLLLSQNPNRRLAAILSGAGFGLFIDEVGKFVTSDVNYFYKPAAVIIYLSFVGIWLISRVIITRSMNQPLLSPVGWPQRRLLQVAMIIFLGLVTFGAIIDIVKLVVSAVSEPNFALYGANLLGYILFVLNVIYIGLLIMAAVRFRQNKKQQALTLVREALVLSLVALLPVNFYKDQFEAFSSLFYYLAFISIITKRDSWKKLKDFAKRSA